MTESETRFEAGQSGEGSEGYIDASGADIATQPRFDEAGALGIGDRLLLQLNDGWRLVHDGSLQWTLQRRHSTPRKTAKWSGRRFHVERDPLLRSIAELCGPVDASAVETIKGWPPRYCRTFPVWQPSPHR